MSSRRKLKISPHHHTGKHLAHHHTSWAALIFIMLLGGLALGALTLAAAYPSIAGPGDTITSNGNIQVKAIVPGPPPATAPVITTPANGSHQPNPELDIYGSCEADLTVVVSSNDVETGSAVCDSGGGFSMHISLFDDRNDLIARQYDWINQSSPPSDTVTTYFDKPATTNRPTTPTSSNSSVGGGTNSTVPATTKPLIIKTDFHIQGVGAHADFTLPLELIGGLPPYAVSVDWGDGETTLLSRPSLGRFHSSHIYTKAGLFKIVIKVSDSLGQAAYRQTVALIPGLNPATTTSVLGGRLLIAWPVYIAMALLLIGFGLGDLYDRQHRPTPKSTT